MAEGRDRGRGEARLSPLEKNLRQAVRGDVLFDAASRGRYATDASIYQVEPVGIVIPRDETDLAVALDVARDAKAVQITRNRCRHLTKMADPIEGLRGAFGLLAKPPQ